MRRLSALLVLLVLPWVPAAPALAAEDPGTVECQLVPLGPVPRVWPEGHGRSPLKSGKCAGVRPGALVDTAGRGECTLNYVFHGIDPRDEEKRLHRFIATAGHCVLQSAGERVWAPGTGLVARDVDGRRFGEYAYAVYAPDRDFALIRLDPETRADPQVCEFGGPTGVNNDRTTSAVTLRHYGQGVLLADAVPGRTAYATALDQRDVAYAFGATSFGDSGSPVNSADGRAVGLVIALAITLNGSGGSGTIKMTRLQPQLDRAGQALGLQMWLVTAPRTDATGAAGEDASPRS